MNFIITNEIKLSQLDEIVDHMRGPRLWMPKFQYPDMNDWLQKVHSQLKSETKKVVIAISRNVIIGSLVYQKHLVSEMLELKNLTVRPDMQGRYLASFMLRNAEIEGVRDFAVNKVICDTKANNLPVRALLEHSGYKLIGVVDLYRLSGGQDVVYTKTVK